jgi:energy-coupling factor transporter ATP-binding protein EcfA2
MTATQPSPASAAPAADLAEAPVGGGPWSVVVDDLTHIYSRGKVRALDHVSVRIAPGEIVGVVGQNGSGKTTLTKHLNGLLKPTEGRVTVAGIETTRRRVQELAAHVGYVFQNPNHQLFASSVEVDLGFGPRNLGLGPEEVTERVDQAIAFFGLEAVRHLHPYRISFPLRKLVGIAAIYTMRPEIFVLDEPSTGQDHITTRKINELIRRLRADGSTVICVSHDMQLMADVVDRVLVMWDGKLIADRAPREVFADREVMTRTNLEPPQITEISLRLRARTGQPPALSVAELADTIGPTMRPAGESRVV